MSDTDAARIAEIRRVLAYSRTPAGEGLIRPGTQKSLDFLLARIQPAGGHTCPVCGGCRISIYCCFTTCSCEDGP